MKAKKTTDEPITDLRRLKGQITRERLILEAIRLFGLRGYKGTNTRALAEASRCNLGLITFHFTGKQGLYNAALERVKLRFTEITAPSLQAFQENLTMKISPEELLLRTDKVLREFLQSLVGMEEIVGHALLLLRDSHEKTNLASGSYREVFSPFVFVLEKSINIATLCKDPLQARIRAFLIINSVLGFLSDYPLFFEQSLDGEIEPPNISYFTDIVSRYLLTACNDTV